MNDIDIDKRTMQFLERHKDLINEMKMQDLYYLFLKENTSTAYFTRSNNLSTNQLTYIFLKAGFEPLKYMNSVPKGYALNLGLEEVIIPSCITAIDEKAFIGNPSLKHLELTDSIKKIATDAFSAIMTHCDINYVGDIENYVSTKNIGKLSMTTVTLYINNNKPIAVDIHSAKRIEDAAFYCNEDIKNLKLGKQIKYIGWNAFNHCRNLSEIIYDGSIDQFNLIDIKPKAFSDIQAKTIQCLDDVVQVEDLD